MGCCSSKLDTVPLDPTPENTQLISTVDGTASTPGAAMGARAQPQGAAWLQRPHNDGRASRLRHPEAMYSPHNIQVARECLRANIRPVKRIICGGIDWCR